MCAIRPLSIATSCCTPSFPLSTTRSSLPTYSLQLQEALAGRREAETDAQLLRAELEQLQQSLTGTGGLSPAWAGDRGRGGFKAAPHPDAALAAARASGRSGGTQPGLSTSLDDVSFMSVSEGGEGASPDSQFTPSPPHPGRPEVRGGSGPRWGSGCVCLQEKVRAALRPHRDCAEAG